MNREEEVLEAISYPVTPARMARILNLYYPCEWCPVEPPRKGNLCVVPDASRQRVRRVLESLHRQGKIGCYQLRYKVYYAGTTI